LTYRWVEHTAELGLEVEAPSKELVFVESMHALAELLEGSPAEGEAREVWLEAPDSPALLVAWLEELLFLADTVGFVPEEAEIDLDEMKLHAVVRGRRTEARPLVKAVTYHGLQLEPAGDGWRATVVLDV
jgi:SHS2 domain-containing protein